MNTRPRAFTLVEVMVSTLIVATLSALGVAAFHSMRERARMGSEIQAGRNLATAYLNYAGDHGGRLLAGYESDPEATNLEGETLHHPVNARYPWRLAPYAPSVEGVLLVNGNRKLMESKDRDYMISVQPNLGINAVFVGGHFGSGSPLRPSKRMIDKVGKYYVSRLQQAFAPENLTVFASARHDGGTDAVGYFEVRPPNITATEWSGARFEPEEPASDFGFVDFRWDGKAVVAMLGGNVELMDEEELRDMRHWSNQAARANNPDFRVGTSR